MSAAAIVPFVVGTATSFVVSKVANKVFGDSFLGNVIGMAAGMWAGGLANAHFGGAGAAAPKAPGGSVAGTPQFTPGSASNIAMQNTGMPGAEQLFPSPEGAGILESNIPQNTGTASFTPQAVTAGGIPPAAGGGNLLDSAIGFIGKQWNSLGDMSKASLIQGIGSGYGKHKEMELEEDKLGFQKEKYYNRYGTDEAGRNRIRSALAPYRDVSAAFDSSFGKGFSRIYQQRRA